MSADDPFARTQSLPDGSGLRLGIVVSRFNRAVTARLLGGAREALRECGVSEDDIDVVSVPGALEIPVVARGMIGRGDVPMRSSPTMLSSMYASSRSRSVPAVT